MTMARVCRKTMCKPTPGFNIAAAQGNELAKENKERVTESMTNEGRARAQKLAHEYWEAYVLPFRN